MHFVMISVLICIGILAVRADDLGGGGYFSRGSIIGLSRGIEIGRGYKRGPPSRAQSYIRSTRSSRDWAQAESYQRKTSIGFIGSYFGAPVDLKQVQVIRVEVPGRGQAQSGIDYRELEALLNRVRSESSGKNEVLEQETTEGSQEATSVVSNSGNPVDLEQEQVISVEDSSREEVEEPQENEASERAETEGSETSTTADTGSSSEAPVDLKEEQNVGVEGPSQGEAESSSGKNETSEQGSTGGSQMAISIVSNSGVPVDLKQEEVVRVEGPNRGEAKQNETATQAETEGSQEETSTGNTESSSEAPVDMKQEQAVRVESPTSRSEAKISITYKELEALLNRKGSERSQENEASASNSVKQETEQNQINREESSKKKTGSRLSFRLPIDLRLEGLNGETNIRKNGAPLGVLYAALDSTNKNIDSDGLKLNLAERTEENKKSDQNGGEARSAIGFAGSDFGTPVDVKRQEIIRLKARPVYKYDYRVADSKSNDYKSASEQRDGSQVRGTYSFLEPDLKTVRVVDYTADKDQGFVAKVSFRNRNSNDF